MASNPPQGQLVILSWNDAHTDVAEFSMAELNDRHKPMVIETVGWLLRADTEFGVSLANEKTGPDTFRGFTFVPNGMINSLKPFKNPRKRKPKSEPTLTPQQPEASNQPV